MTTKTSSIGHRPDGKWRFDQNVTTCFADMLERSIPDYRTMRQLTLDIGSRFVQRATHVLDIGCSRGDSLLPFIEKFGSLNFYVGLDESPAMVEAAEKNLCEWTVTRIASIRQHDLRDGLPPLMPSLILSVLTLQFVPIEFRQQIIADAYRILRPGGALMLVEKTLGDDAASDKVLVDTYLKLKAANGYSADDIAEKRKALQGVLVPMTAAANESMLRAEGFRVQRFWQALQFVGWVAVKPKAGA